ncbi:MAG: GDSL-type esterase/lipase family protein, partial [Actinomycetes bacterium]
MLHERVVALGDSVTFGVGDDGPNFIGPGWGARVAHQLNATRFLNLSNLGARVRQLSESQLPAALAFRPTISIISIGGNDILRSRFNPAEVECHLEKVVISLKMIGSEVVLLKIPDHKKTAPG